MRTGASTYLEEDNVKHFKVRAITSRGQYEHDFVAADADAAGKKMREYLVKRQFISQNQCVYAQDFDVTEQPYVVFWVHGISTKLGGVKAKMKSFVVQSEATAFKKKLDDIMWMEKLFQQGYVLYVSSNF